MNVSFKNMVIYLFMIIFTFEILFYFTDGIGYSIFNLHSFQDLLNASADISSIETLMGNWGIQFTIPSLFFGAKPYTIGVSFNWLRNAFAYIIFVPYFLVEFFIDLGTFIVDMFYQLSTPFNILPSPYNSIIEGLISVFVIIGMVMSIQVMSTSIGGKN